MLNFRDYLNYAERYLRLAEEHLATSSEIDWLLIPAAILAWTAIESFVNNRLDDLTTIPEDFELHEKAFLLEKRIRFLDHGTQIGQFVLEGTEYRRLEDKIFFLIAKSGVANRSYLRGQSLWQRFEEFKKIRDAIIHPRLDKQIVLDIDIVRDHIQTSKQVIQLVSKHLWNKEVQF